MKLKGITWNHTRGYLPMMATAQRYNELHPDVEIVWHKRSLQEFADYPIEKLSEKFDLLIIDHPFVGHADAHSTLIRLDKLLPETFLQGQINNSVGKSYESYLYRGQLWALPVDAAAPVSAFRPDLMAKNRWSIPQNWDDLITLARQGLVVVPALPIDSLMNFYMLCCGLGEEPFASGDNVVSKEVGIAALSYLRELVRLCPPQCLTFNPIAVYEMLAVSDKIFYCPFAYGYSNYARLSYGSHVLHFGELVRMNNGMKLRSTLGGTGLAISQRCQNIDVAVAYTEFVASQECQKGIYYSSGGQPACRLTWQDASINSNCNQFFSNTLSTVEEAYLRPRYNGYLYFQDHAGDEIHKFLRGKGDPQHVFRKMEDLRQRSLRS
jgi:multiple sugar transport system substrate-binding protein